MRRRGADNYDHIYKIFIHKQCEFANEFNKIICIYFARSRKIDFKKRTPIFSRLYILGTGKIFSPHQNLFSLILRCWQFDYNYKIFIHKICKFTNEFNKIICIFNKIFCAIAENWLQKKEPHLFEAIYPGGRKKIFVLSEFIFVNIEVLTIWS